MADAAAAATASLRASTDEDATPAAVARLRAVLTALGEENDPGSWRGQVAACRLLVSSRLGLLPAAAGSAMADIAARVGGADARLAEAAAAASARSTVLGRAGAERVILSMAEEKVAGGVLAAAAVRWEGLRPLSGGLEGRAA